MIDCNSNSTLVLGNIALVLTSTSHMPLVTSGLCIGTDNEIIPSALPNCQSVAGPIVKVWKNQEYSQKLIYPSTRPVVLPCHIVV